MIRGKKSASLMKRRVLASIICLGIVIVSLIALGVVKALVNVTAWTDADGTKYYVRQVGEVYGLYDENKVELKKESAYQYYATALGTLVEVEGTQQLGRLLAAQGWTPLTAVCTMLFSLFHWPCSTTCLTVAKETGRAKWTVLAVLVPTLVGVMLCMTVAAVGRLWTG